MIDAADISPSLDHRSSDATDPKANAAAQEQAYAAQEAGDPASPPPELNPSAPALATAVPPNPMIPPTVAEVDVTASATRRSIP
jgi:hypothetical protein